MNPKVMQGGTIAVALVIAVAGFVWGGPYGWVFGLVGLAVAALATIALIKGWSLFGSPGPF